MAEAAVACPAEQTAHLAGRMTMVDVEPAMLLADPANAALAGQECITIVQGHAIAAPKALGFSFSAPARVELVLVSCPVGAQAFTLFLSIFRVFGQLLSSPNGLAGNHLCFPPQSHW